MVVDIDADAEVVMIVVCFAVVVGGVQVELGLEHLIFFGKVTN